MKPYITLFHHRHGTSSALIVAENEAEAEKQAEAMWIEVDGMEKDLEQREACEESFEVGEASCMTPGYKVEVRKED